MSAISKSMYQADFVKHEIKPRQNIIDPHCVVTKPPPPPRSNYRPVQMDIQVFQPYKHDVPFNLFHQNKPIIQSKPSDPFPKVKFQENLYNRKLEARRRRNAPILTPQINLDKIPEVVMYGEDKEGGLAASIYSSEKRQATEIALKYWPFKFTDDPLQRDYVIDDLLDKSIDNTRFKSPSTVYPMEVGLEKHVSEWNKHYPLEVVDTTKMYWEKNTKKIGLCPLCDPQESAPSLTAEETEELNKCLKDDNLRTPFVVHPSGYKGYVPHLADGIGFRKKLFSKYDTFVSTTMLNQGVYDKNAI